MRVTFSIKKGPMAGKERTLDPDAALSGRIVVGREPGYDGLILEGDATVSRRHGEIFVHGRDLIFANLGGHGTVIDGVHCLGQQVLQPGVSLWVGSHQIEVRFEASSQASQNRGAENLRNQGLWRQGLLAKPAVRLLMVMYLLGLLVLVIMLGGDDDLGSAYREARASYAAEFLPARSLPTSEVQGRLEKTDRLAAELAAHTRAHRWQRAEQICHQLMAFDGDPESPIYRFAARHLGTLAGAR